MEMCGTLLIAERSSELAIHLEPWLTENGYRAIVADSIQAVLIALQCEKITTLVMDTCMLPRKSSEEMGFEAISIIKGLHKDLPIIVTTDENNAEQESRIRQKGIFYYHVKSFGVDELMLAISNAMARSSR
jgi:DNA-binding NtrC family response regulator